ncbi:MAG: sigma factor [Rhizobiaceae bacterium]|nr:sigma factor [Rhizobiaceae bacterium]
MDRRFGEVRAKADKVARASYGRLIAILVSNGADIASAEDALADAFARALETWPKDGIPTNPEGWLVTVARNRRKDAAKSAAARTASGSLDDEDFILVERAAQTDMQEPDHFPDRRLNLIFACAHPAIDAQVHTPLMLQTVLGFQASEIASAYLMPGPVLAQRLVRAKRKIKQAGIAFSLPEPDDLKPRLAAVLEAIYGAYSLDWQNNQNCDPTQDISSEALYLSTLVCELLPDEPEALGLAALIAFSFARRDARIDQQGVYVPLEAHDVSRWNRLLIRRGQTMLAKAATFKAPARFQLEAAIQSAHCDRLQLGKVDWQVIAQLYAGLMAVAPTTGAAVGYAVALGRSASPQAGFAALAAIEGDQTKGFQPYWATRAYLLRQAGYLPDARTAYEKALSLTTHIPSRKWLENELENILQENY